MDEEGEQDLVAEDSPGPDEEEDLEPSSRKRSKLSDNDVVFESSLSQLPATEGERRPGKVFESATAGIMHEIVKRAAVDA
jgi:hypothetical protein